MHAGTSNSTPELHNLEASTYVQQSKVERGVQ